MNCKTIIAVIAAAALLAACGTSGTTSAFSRFPRQDWRCDADRAFSVRFDNKQQAELFAAGRVLVLTAAVTGSGTRYRNGDVEYWEHQGQARLINAFGGPYNNCRQGS
jgi:membrane-bound inhibitor of C-type lysozyme